MKCYGIFIFVTIAVVLFSMSSSRVAVNADTAKECWHSDGCEIYEQCLEKKCVDACHIRNGVKVTDKCGIHAFCYTSNPHTATCRCAPTHTGDPEIGCFQRLAIIYNFYANKN